MAINERLIDTAEEASAPSGGGTGNQEEGLILHLDANDVDSYDGDGSVWYDIKDHEYTPATNVSEHFNTVLYTGTGTTNQITGVGFEPDLIWIKNRDQTDSHAIVDSVRGITSPAPYLASDLNSAEATSTNMPTSVQSDGFTITGNGGRTNTSGEDYVAWCFKAGGAPSGSDKVSIDGTSYSTMSAANLTEGTVSINKLSVNTNLNFSIATYNGNNSTGSVAHGLGVKPELIIIKSLGSTTTWIVYCDEVGATNFLTLDSAAAATTATNRFNNTEPNPNTWTFGTSDNVHTTNEHVVYSFASKRGVSKVGSYTGTGAAGNKVYTGFEPAWLMIKSTGGGSWLIYDNKRDSSNPRRKVLMAHIANTEYADLTDINFEEDGFTIAESGSSNDNTATVKYIYLAFAKNKNAADLTPSTDGEEIEIDLEFDPSNVNYTDSNYSFEQDNTQWNGNADTSSGTHEGEVFMNNYFKSGETGKYYYEIETIKSTHGLIGFTDPTKYAGGDGLSGSVSKSSWRNNYFYGISSANIYTSNGSSSISSFSTGLNTSGQVTAVAIDVASRKVWIGTVSSGNITWFNSGDPANGTNPFFTLPTGWGSYHPLVGDGSYSGSSARYAWLKLLRDSTATTLPTGFTQLKGAIKNADLELHLDPTSYSGSGSTWTADTGNDATISGAAYDQELGDWFDFDGSNDYISVPSTSSTPVDFSAKNYTIEAWINPDTASAFSGPILSKYGTTDSLRSINFNYASNGKLRLFERATGTNVSHDSTITLTTNRWTHVAVTRTSSQVKLYIDGSLDNTISSTFTPNNGGSQNINIGSQANGQYNFFDGKIGQVRVYSSVLTETQIRQNFNFTKNNYPNGFNGAITGATWNPSGYFSFGSSSDKIVINNNKLYDNFSVSLWVQFDDVSPASGYARNVFSKNQFYASSHAGFPFTIINDVANTIRAAISYGNDYSYDVEVTGTIASGTWYHVAVTAEKGDKLKLYLTDENGTFYTTPTSEATYTGTVIDAPNLNYTIGNAAQEVGSGSGKAFLDGNVSKVKMYNKVLTASEISTQFDEGK